MTISIGYRNRIEAHYSTASTLKYSYFHYDADNRQLEMKISH